MTIGFIFWLFMLLWLIGAFASDWPMTDSNRYRMGLNLFLWILLLLLGIGVFGYPVKG